MKNKILILDFGSQYTMLIARRVREFSVYCEIHPFNISIEKIKEFDPGGIVLSGGPSSVFEKDAPSINRDIFSLDIPILGICYGMQLITHLFGGKVIPSMVREYGVSSLLPVLKSPLFTDQSQSLAWMSHGDSISSMPKGFDIVATSGSHIAAIQNLDAKIFGVQFHPEVQHTKCGAQVIGNFIYSICKVSAGWTSKSFIETSINKIREQVGDEKVILGLSGGVDSAVAAELIRRAIGKNLFPIFIDNGLLRKDEVNEIANANLDTICINASDKFMWMLRNIVDPEEKRKRIGKTFIDVFESTAKGRVPDAKFLAQGTLYPDVIESVSVKGPSAIIKSHHNVGGLPKNMKFKLLEPLRELFKDEVRKVGLELGMSEKVVNRQPFPGPGLAVRIIGEVTKNRLETLREADHIVTSEIERWVVDDWEDIIEGAEIPWQYFAVLIPVNTVGVVGDERTYGSMIAIRAVSSQDGMTADWSRLPYDLLQKMSTRITNEVKGINRVVYDISSKPPATIEYL
jgi:GMP synthase (glutamine-hydrolysing)